MKILILISLIALQGCTQVKDFLYWYEHSVNMRMPPEAITQHQKETQYYEDFEASIDEQEQLPW